jgi:exopolysaccharide production protein ExoZ
MSRIVSLQILRGFAATAVVGFHLNVVAIAEGFDPGLFRYFAGGEIGVDIFFVISGFIIYYIAQGRPGMTRKAFLQARFWRLLPPYWAILTLYVCAALALAIVFGDHSNVPSMGQLVVSYLLLPYPDMVIVIAWTLSMEFLFYGLFAVAYFGGGARRLVISMILWTVASQIFLHFVVQKPTWLLMLLHSAVLEFLFGVLIAIYYVARSGAAPRFYLPAFVLGSALVGAHLVTAGGHIPLFGREIEAGIPAAFLVYGMLGFAWKRVDILETWGESSYILYLFHILYFSVVGKAVQILTGINVYGSQLYMLLMLISVVMICYVATVRLERPYQRWYQKKTSPRSPS